MSSEAFSLLKNEKFEVFEGFLLWHLILCRNGRDGTGSTLYDGDEQDDIAHLFLLWQHLVTHTNGIIKNIQIVLVVCSILR